MSTINVLKKEVDLLHKALNINVKIPEWKKQSKKIIELLKEYEQLSLDEKQCQNAEVLAWYKARAKKKPQQPKQT